jgi:hypothetical protein
MSGKKSDDADAGEVKATAMPAMRPTVGRIVHFKVSAGVAEQVNRRRTNGASVGERIQAKIWPLGAQAHVGNEAREGDVLPMVICRVWPEEFGPGADGVNGQVFLDGNDTFWVTSAKEGIGVGEWSWPPRA